MRPTYIVRALLAHSLLLDDNAWIPKISESTSLTMLCASGTKIWDVDVGPMSDSVLPSKPHFPDLPNGMFGNQVEVGRIAGSLIERTNRLLP